MSAFLDASFVAVGWLSAFSGAVAYLLASRGIWDAKSVKFNATNATGAALMVVVSGSAGLWPSAAANAVWVVIGAQALLAIRRDRRAVAVADAQAVVAVAEDVLVAAVLAEVEAPTSPLTIEMPLVREDAALDFSDAARIPAHADGETGAAETAEAVATCETAEAAADRALCEVYETYPTYAAARSTEERSALATA